ncbi:MAG: MFS transporter [Firmicutes bacterium]|nr:MFS transporter [Bacillota bacterium]
MSIGPNVGGGAAKTSLSIGIPQRIERLPITSYQKLISFMIIMAVFFDAVDMGALTYLLPTLAQHFKLDSVMTGFLGSIGLAGMFLGAITSGILTDKFGRKAILMVCIILWGVSGLLVAMSWSVSSLFIFRFLLGIGLGGSYPAANSMVPEFLPKASRGRYSSLMEGLAPIGVLCAGIIAFFVLPNIGWRWVFVIEAIPAFWVLVIWRYVPESPRWLESSGRKKEAEAVMGQIEAEVEKRYGSSLPPVDTSVATETDIKKASFAELWSRNYYKRTIMLWVLWATSLFGYYAINLWLGALLVAKGFTVTKSIGYVILMTAGAIPGVLLTTYLIERLGRKPLVVVSMIGTALAAYFYGQAQTLPMVITCGLLMQFFLWIMWPSIYTYTPELYPTRMRGTGCGFSQAFGRLASLLGPSVTGVILASSLGQSMVFTVAGVTFVVGALVVLLLGPETKGRALEEVSS